MIFCQEEEERAELYNRVAKEVEEHALVCCAIRLVCCTVKGEEKRVELYKKANDEHAFVCCAISWVVVFSARVRNTG